MPYRTIWLNHGIEWQFTGTVTSADILQSNMEIYGDSRFDSLQYQIVNFLNMDSFQFTEKDIKKVAYFDMAASKTNPDLKVAVITNQEILGDYSNLYAAYTLDIDWETKVFENRDSALEWLGLKRPGDYQV